MSKQILSSECFVERVLGENIIQKTNTMKERLKVESAMDMAACGLLMVHSTTGIGPMTWKMAWDSMLLVSCTIAVDLYKKSVFCKD